MATFSTNQVKQLYVAKALNGSLTTLGDIAFAAAGDGQIIAKYVNRSGNGDDTVTTRTDLIDLATLKAKAIKSSSMSQYLESAYIPCTAAVAGQQYILKVTVDEFGGISPEDKGFIFAEYTAASGDAAKNILVGLAISLAKNATKAAYNKLINVFVTTGDYDDALTIGTNAWEVAPSSNPATLAANAIAGIVIEAAPQPWVPGKMPYDRLHFSVSFDKIFNQNLPVAWTSVSMNTSHPSAAVVNSKKIADLEAFAAGERGDIYRGMGYPNNFDFQPIVNADATYGYHVLELTWAYQGGAEDIQKSPKELVIVVPAEGLTTYTAINNIIGTASSAAATGSLNKAIYDSGSSAFVAQLS